MPAFPPEPLATGHTRPDLTEDLSRLARGAPESGIVEVFNYGRLKEGLIPLWVGEGDLPTPAFISEAATRGLAAGETFYTWQRGIPDLRAALAAYHERLFERAFSPERFFVTIGGMHAIHIAVALVVEPGQEVLVPSPAWPNVAAAVELAGGLVRSVPMGFSPSGWSLDLDRLEATIGPNTRAILINSPSNPTGWAADRQTLVAVLELARRHRLWIIADEVYGRFSFTGERAASFHDVADEENDRILYVNTFSKNWAMTGWRVGWLEAPEAFGSTIENLVQYTTSGVSAFLQRGALAAIERGEDFIAFQKARVGRALDVMTQALAATNRVTFAQPDGAFYLFMAIDGFEDTRRLALRLIDEAGVGVAPGTAFGPGGERFLRLCLARSEAHVATAAERLQTWLRTA